MRKAQNSKNVVFINVFVDFFKQRYYNIRAKWKMICGDNKNAENRATEYNRTGN